MSRRRIESFLLRLVVEDLDGADPEAWRGRIQHIGSGYERQFDHIKDILSFIREHLEVGDSVFDEPGQCR